MIYWLDNNQSRGDAPNENYGRELLELFSMGIGNYSEDDVKASARAFTGWTLAPTLPRQPYGRFDWEFNTVQNSTTTGNLPRGDWAVER